MFVILAVSSGASAQDVPDWSDVGPLFAERCVICHSGEEAPLGLRLDSYEGATAGSQDGPVLVRGDPGASELIRRVRGQSLPAMPLVGDPLVAEEIAMIEAWIVAGLPEGPPAPAEPPPAEPLLAEPAAAAVPGPDDPVTFAHVQTIFLQRCAVCHSDARAEGPPEGLRLDSYENTIRGGERLAVLPGNPEASEIVRRIEGTARPRMPYDGPPWLDDDQVRLIRQWIDQGAADSEGVEAPVPVGREVRFRGVLTGPSSIDGVEFQLDGGTRIDDRPTEGRSAELRGVVGEDGEILATRLRSRGDEDENEDDAGGGDGSDADDEDDSGRGRGRGGDEDDD